jgi:hypothetical protein
MRTASTRELKQNPAAVITYVLETGDDVEITAHGHRTGVRLVRDGDTGPVPWVSGAALSALEPLSAENAAELQAAVAGLRDGDVEDPWDRA